MNELNIAAYIETLRPGFMHNSSQESAARLIMNSINDQEYVEKKGWYTNLSSKKISLIMSHDSPVPEGMKKASFEQKVVSDVLEYFDDEVVADLNPHLQDDTLEQMASLIQQDKIISNAKREFLLDLYKAEEVGRFLAETFLYVVNRDNKKSEVGDLVEYWDAPLLAEVNYECPITHEKLIETVKGEPLKRYVITQIYPDNLDETMESEFSAIYPRPLDFDAEENLIALSEKYASEYLIKPTVEEYRHLYETKHEIATRYKAASSINRADLEEEIRMVVGSLMNINESTELVTLSYDALKIDKKFKPENYILKNEAMVRILNYYRFIEKVFNESDVDFDLVASEIQTSSMKLEKSGMSQGDVIETLAEWIRNKAKLGSNSKTACNIVVAFFIQNCEVFKKNEISEQSDAI